MELIQTKKLELTIRDAIQYIGEKTILVPAIQRQFVWKWTQIEMLFDSLMQGYPINTFMFWKVSSTENKSKLHFYEILKNYVEGHQEDNPDAGDRRLCGDFYAVIDGQQRLTSLYIGLAGTYAYRYKGKWRTQKRDYNVTPDRELYLNIAGPLQEPSEMERGMQYQFKFLTKQAVSDASTKESGEPHPIWFKVGSIIDLDTPEKWSAIAETCPNRDFAYKTLCRLHTVVFSEKLISGYVEENQDLTRVLDVFLRANSGGTKLTYADLLMSVATANWKEIDARKWTDEIVKAGRNCSITIDRQWVLKTGLYLSDAPVRFSSTSFGEETVRSIETQSDSFRDCIITSFDLLKYYGFTDEALRAKNAILPIAYYLLKSEFAGEPLYRKILTHDNLEPHRKAIVQWLSIVILKRTFGGQSDSVLTDMRNILKVSMSAQDETPNIMPLGKMVAKFEATTKDLRFDSVSISRLLKVHKNDPSCRAVLFLLFPELKRDVAYDIDHLHPGKWFSPKELSKRSFLNSDKQLSEFYRDKENWDTLPNLHLLARSTNRVRQELPLVDWVNEGLNRHPPEDRRWDMLLPNDFDLAFQNFRNFIKFRSTAIADKLKEMIVAAGCWSNGEISQPDEDESDEVGDADRESAPSPKRIGAKTARRKVRRNGAEKPIPSAINECLSAYPSFRAGPASENIATSELDSILPPSKNQTGGWARSQEIYRLWVRETQKNDGVRLTLELGPGPIPGNKPANLALIPEAAKAFMERVPGFNEWAPKGRFKIFRYDLFSEQCKLEYGSIHAAISRLLEKLQQWQQQGCPFPAN